MSIWPNGQFSQASFYIEYVPRDRLGPELSGELGSKNKLHTYDIMEKTMLFKHAYAFCSSLFLRLLQNESNDDLSSYL